MRVQDSDHLSSTNQQFSDAENQTKSIEKNKVQNVIISQSKSCNELGMSSQTAETKYQVPFCEANVQLPADLLSKSTEASISPFLLSEMIGEFGYVNKKKTVAISGSHQEIATPSSIRSLKRLSNLYRVCLKFFNEETPVSEDFQLSPNEISLLNSLLKRKFAKGLTKSHLQSDSIAIIEAILKICSKKHNKRPEECYKFVLSRIFKLLKTRFFVWKKLERIENEHAFYHHYFGTLCSEGKIAITDFFIRSKSSETKTPTKVSVKYIMLIARSEQFRRDLNHLLSGEFYTLCRAEISHKLSKLFEKLEKWIQQDKEEEASSWQRASSYINNDRFCKLSWTITEVRQAVERFSFIWESTIAELSK